MKKKQTSKGIKAKFVKVASIEDIARLACDFSNRISPIFCTREKGRTVLMCPAEKAGGAVNVYTFEGSGIKNYLVYDPSGEDRDKVESKEELAEDIHNFKVYKISVVELSTIPFITKKPKKKAEIKMCRVQDYMKMVRLLINRFDGDDKPGKVYAFMAKGQQYLCSFEILGTEEEQIAVYAKVPYNIKRNFLVYDYTKDRVSEADTLMNNVYPHVRIINLAEAFDFFKPE
jgi:hypothetical protein